MTSDAPEQRPPHHPLVPPGGVKLHARDMTATFSADITLGDAQRKLGEIDQWLPIDGVPSQTLGQLVEQKSTGPLRLGYGAWRDLLLGVQFTNGRGELITAGGRTVKNVAGYDLTKFMVGQHGIFGRLFTLTTRTYRRPDGAVLARHWPDPSVVGRLIPTPLRPQWVVLTPDALLCGYLGDDTTLAWYEANLPSTEPLEITRRSVEDDVEHRLSLWSKQGAGAGEVVFRASVPPARLTDFVSKLPVPSWSADAAFGVVVGAVESSAQSASVRELATSLGGAALFRACVETTESPVDFSTSPAEHRIIEGLKRAFDPDNRLRPLPWQTQKEPVRP